MITGPRDAAATEYPLGEVYQGGISDYLWGLYNSWRREHILAYMHIEVFNILCYMHIEVFNRVRGDI